jgi:hypothetical protein
MAATVRTRGSGANKPPPHHHKGHDGHKGKTPKGFPSVPFVSLVVSQRREVEDFADP